MMWSRLVMIFIMITSYYVGLSQIIEVSFKKNGIEEVLYDNFELLLEFRGEIIKCKVLNNQIELPNIDKSEYDTCNVVFQYSDMKMTFERVPVMNLIHDQKVKWIFKVQEPPFSENYEGVDWSRVIEIHYWVFDVQEKGMGLEIINPIMRKH